jgi:hypothetical protein
MTKREKHAQKEGNEYKEVVTKLKNEESEKDKAK